MLRLPRGLTLSLVTIMLLALLTGCMGDDDDDATPETADAVTAESVLESASARWSETTSAHFKLTIDGETFLDSDNTIKLNSAEGDIKRPGSVSATADVGVPVLGNKEISLIATDGTVYMTNLLSGDWEESPADFSYDPSILFSDTEGIGPILTELQNPTLEDDEAVEGRDAHVVTGTVTEDQVSGVTAGAVAGESIDVTVWVDTETSDILKVSLTEPEGVREDPATWNLVFTEFNEDVTIEPPAL
jgi:hypothetical protein